MNEIESLELTEVTIDEIIPLVKSFLSGTPVWHTKLVYPSFIYRCIKYDVKPTIFSEIVYPPVHKAAQNRANRTGNSMFYGSLEMKAALHEINAKIGDFVAIGKWNVAEPLLVANSGYFKGDFFLDKREMPEWGKFDEPGFNLEIQSFVSDYIAEKFSQTGNVISKQHYNITNAISEVKMSLPDVEGMLYPSVVLKGMYDNIVINPSVIDSKKLILMHVEWLQIADIQDNGKFLLHNIDIATEVGRDGFLYWKGRPRTWINLSPEWYFDEDGGVRDAFGNLIEPT